MVLGKGEELPGKRGGDDDAKICATQLASASALRHTQGVPTAQFLESVSPAFACLKLAPTVVGQMVGKLMLVNGGSTLDGYVGWQIKVQEFFTQGIVFSKSL